MGENDGVESAALIYTCTPAQAQPQLLLADRFERKKPYINLPLSHKYISALGDHEAAHYTTSWERDMWHPQWQVEHPHVTSLAGLEKNLLKFKGVWCLLRAEKREDALLWQGRSPGNRVPGFHSQQGNINYRWEEKNHGRLDLRAAASCLGRRAIFFAQVNLLPGLFCRWT